MISEVPTAHVTFINDSTHSMEINWAFIVKIPPGEKYTWYPILGVYGLHLKVILPNGMQTQWVDVSNKKDMIFSNEGLKSLLNKGVFHPKRFKNETSSPIEVLWSSMVIVLQKSKSMVVHAALLPRITSLFVPLTKQYLELKSGDVAIYNDFERARIIR